MKLTKGNIKKVIAENFSDYLVVNQIRIIKEDDKYLIARDMRQGVNAGVRLNDPNWEETLISHIKWQLGI